AGRRAHSFPTRRSSDREVARAPMSLIPGPYFIDNYLAVLTGSGRTPDVARMMWVSTVMAMVIAVGKIVISMLSAFAVVYFRFRRSEEHTSELQSRENLV